MIYDIYSDTSSEWNPSQLVSISMCWLKFTSVCNQNGKSNSFLFGSERVWEFNVSQYLSQCVNYVHCSVYTTSNIYK